MREAEQLPDGIRFENKHLQQLILSWVGAAGDGTDAQLAGIPLRQTSVDNDTLYAITARNRGTGGKHVKVLSSDGLTTLLDITDTGVLFSVGGTAATNAGVYPNMVVGWTATLASIPAGYTVVAASQGRFPYGASVDGDLGATGGSATYDVSHTHTGPSHAHDGATGAAGTADTGFGGGGNTGSGGAASTDNDGGGTTNSGGTASTDNDGAFSGNTGDGGGFTTSTPVPGQRSVTDDGSNQVDVSDVDHEHTEGDHDHSITIGSHDHAIANHSHTVTSHDHTIASHTHSGPTHQHSGPSHDHGISFGGTGATGSGGSATQSILPPYWRCYWIERD